MGTTSNSPMERFFRGLKTEWVPQIGYHSFNEAKQSVWGGILSVITAK